MLKLVLCFALSLICAATAANARLFSADVPTHQWTQFEAAGFALPVSGVVYNLDKRPCCGIPLGGVGTWCLDVDTDGTFGFCNVFQSYPRRAKLFAPFLGISVGGSTWLLASEEAVRGGRRVGCVEPGTDPWNPTPDWSRHVLAQRGVRAAEGIRYWGHYPVADLEFQTDAPVEVSLRAWSPFLPGDAGASNIPGAVFEVHLRNRTARLHKGTVAFSFPGPSEEAAGGTVFHRSEEGGDLKLVRVRAPKADYTLGVIGQAHVRFGAGLDASSDAWRRISSALPEPVQEHGGASAAVEFSLKPGESHVVRFVLAWFVPTFGETTYHQMYASRYRDSSDVAAALASGHESLLSRVLAWQQEVYGESDLPVWLRDSLVNILALIAESSYWVQSRPPLEWAGAAGAYGMIESPRVCPQIECIPCSWYGNIPIVYFFPELAHSTLKGYKAYQASNGAAPFLFGPKNEFWQEGHAWQNQIALNGVCYVDMVNRVWLRTGDDAILREFYESVKKSTTLTALMGEPPASVISMPPGEGQTEWWEGWPWTGMTPHVGGMHLSNLAIAANMARAMGDAQFQAQCRAWLEEGQRDMEDRMWNGDSYLLMWNLNTGKKDDRIMANQLDAEWANSYHGLPGVFRSDRVKTVLETVRKTCLVDTGAVSFSSRKGEPELKTYGIFIPEIIILGMTYAYNGDAHLGLDITRRMMETSVLRHGMQWDMTNQVRADTGARTFGTDYYQDMILWALPAALEGRTLKSDCAPGTLVDRILKRAR